MIKHQAQAQLTDVLNKNKIVVDINWSKAYKDCIKFTIGDTQVIIPKAELFQLLFTVSNPEQQAEMMIVDEKLVRPHARKHIVKLTKDMKAGETLNVHCEVNIPEILRQAFKQELIKNGEEIHADHLNI